MTETTAIACDVVGESLKDIAFTNVSRSRLGVSVPYHVDTDSTNQLRQINIPEALELRVDRVHEPPVFCP